MQGSYRFDALELCMPAIWSARREETEIKMFVMDEGITHDSKLRGITFTCSNISESRYFRPNLTTTDSCTQLLLRYRGL